MMIETTNDLALTKSGLYVRDQFLYKQKKDGTIIGKHDINTLTRISLIWTVDFLAITFFLGCAALAVVAKMFIHSKGWSWTTTIVMGVASLLCLIINFKKYWISMESKDGTAKYVLLDDPGELEGFVFTLQSMMNNSGYGNSATNDSNVLHNELQDV